MPILFTYSPCDFPGGSDGKASAYDAGDPGSVPGWGRSPGEEKGYPLQYSGLEKSMDSIVHGVPKSWTQLSDFGGSDRKASACNVGDLGLIHGSGRSSGERNGNSLQYSCLENSMD